ncbi:anti-FecI sigma factor, FecR [Lunatimonas lonarensis]|uniref:Anti-FecI sigma factor, FecR n=1 Tax=Lunatimonas lonarensis TaxID=1232681 RepID=R7ZWZ0_9BACT|nr:FecR family protein [Lunatimonas lonarensis]EON78533.1 anti-FecI sigma factor, FecR [Lunatimonas lonarensis]
MRYRDYKLEHFLADEFFIQWVKNPDANNRHFWEKWLQEHPEKRATVLEAAQLIRAVKYRTHVVVSDSVYVEAFENILRASGHGLSTQGDLSGISQWFCFFTLRKLVAMLVLGFCAWMAFVHMIQQQQEVDHVVVEVPQVTKQNPYGIKSLITLTDGSKVHLNAGSSIAYPKEFGSEARVVRLTGEAFFEVEPEFERPFIVETGNARVEVLGTSFNVNQQDGGNISVALVTGKVRVKDESGSLVNLEPNEMLIMEQGGKLHKTGFDPLEVLGWKEKRLVFKKDSFESVKQKIERWYGVEVQVKGKSPQGWAYTGVYLDEMLENVLTGIFYTSGITYRIEGKKVTITNPR